MLGNFFTVFNFFILIFYFIIMNIVLFSIFLNIWYIWKDCFQLKDVRFFIFYFLFLHISVIFYFLNIY